MEKNKVNDYLGQLKQLDEQLNSLFTEVESDEKLDSDINVIKNLTNVITALENDVKEESKQKDNSLNVRIKILDEKAVVPTYSKPGDAGMDLTITSIIEDSRDKIKYGYGIAVEIPEGYVGLVFPRSSISKKDLLMTNSVGVIDCVPAGTKISTVNGDINVEELFNDISTPIISYNEELNDIEVDEISDMWIVEGKKLLKITTDTGIIEIPYEKEVFTKSGWKKAIDLTKDDEILRIN